MAALLSGSLVCSRLRFCCFVSLWQPKTAKQAPVRPFGVPLVRHSLSFIPRRALVPCGRQKFARLLAGQCVRVIPDRRVGNRRKARSACAAKRGKETAKNNTARAFGLFYVNFEVELAADASRRKVCEKNRKLCWVAAVDVK